MNRSNICLGLLLAALAITGCERKQPPPDAPSAAQAAGALAPAVSREEAANATFSTENTASGFLQLRHGHFEDSDMVVADLDDLSAHGDIDGDGTQDLVVVLITSTGGSGVFRDVYALRRVNGQLVVSAAGLLGDRVVVNDLRIEHGEVVADLVVQGENDPLCCPTLPVTYRFRLAGNTLTEVSGQQRLYLRM